MDCKLELSLNTSVLIEQGYDLVPFTLDVPFQLASADGKIIEQVADGNDGALLTCNHRSSRELSRWIKIELSCLWVIAG